MEGVLKSQTISPYTHLLSPLPNRSLPDVAINKKIGHSGDPLPASTAGGRQRGSAPPPMPQHEYLLRHPLACRSQTAPHPAQNPVFPFPPAQAHRPALPNPARVVKLLRLAVASPTSFPRGEPHRQLELKRAAAHAERTRGREGEETTPPHHHHQEVAREGGEVTSPFPLT